MKTLPRHIILLVSMLMVSSCSKEVSQDELIKGAVQLKIEQWQAIQIAECKEKIFIKAEDYVDSLLVVTSLESKLDTIPKPLKPSKPAKPSFKAKPDSVLVEPIYDQEDQ
jgi:hypothetical protein